MRGFIQGNGAIERGLEQSRTGRRLARYGSVLSLFGVMAAGCAAQDTSNDTSTGATSAGGSGAGTGGQSNAGTTNAPGGTSSQAGNASAGVASTQAMGGGSGTSGATGGGGKAGSAGAGGGAGTGGSAGAGGSGGSAGASGSAGAGGKGGAGGSAGAGGGGGSGGKGGSGGSAGAGGSAGGTSCSVVTDCAAQSVCEASMCRPRGCNATNCAYDLTSFVVGTAVAASARGQAFVTWDATKLSVDFQVLDQTAQNDSTANYDDDAVELFFDLNHARSGAYDADDFQIFVPRDAGTLSGTASINFAAITVTRIENAKGYELKVSVPWNALNGAASPVGKTIGFDLAIDDDRDGGARETQVALYGNQNAYQDDKQFGDLTLTP